jgi:hypothetical protein
MFKKGFSIFIGLEIRKISHVEEMIRRRIVMKSVKEVWLAVIGKYICHAVRQRGVRPTGILIAISEGTTSFFVPELLEEVSMVCAED